MVKTLLLLLLLIIILFTFFFHSHRLSSKCFELTGEYGEDELYDGYRQNKDDFKMFLCQQLTNDCKPGNDKKKVEL